MISTMTVGLVAAILANQIETSRPVVGPLEPRFQVVQGMRADGTVKTGYLVHQPICVDDWVVLSLEKSRAGGGSGNCFGGIIQEKKKTPLPSARRAQIGSANKDGLVAWNVGTGRTIELIFPPSHRQPDRANSVSACYRAGPGRCAVVIEQQQKTGPDTGKVLGTYLWEWSLADNSVRPIGNCDAAAVLRLCLDPQFVEVRLVRTNENQVRLAVRDKETGRTTQVSLDNPRLLDPYESADLAYSDGPDTVISYPDRRSFIVYRSGSDVSPRFFRVDPRSPNGRTWSLSDADLERRTGRKESVIFPIAGSSSQRGLIGIGLIHPESGIDHVVTLDASTGQIRQVSPLPESGPDEERRDWVVSRDASAVAYISDLDSHSRNTSSLNTVALVRVDLKTARATRFTLPDMRYHWIDGVLDFDQRGRLLVAGDDKLERVTIGQPLSFETAFELNLPITPQDRLLTAMGLRQLGNLQSLTSLELSQIVVTPEMFGELSRLHALTNLRINFGDQSVGDFKGLGGCANLRSLALDLAFADRSLYREISGLANL